MQMTKMFPKQVVADTTHTNTLRTMFASRSSNDEMPSVLGLQLRTCGAYPQYWNFLKYLSRRANWCCNQRWAEQQQNFRIQNRKYRWEVSWQLLTYFFFFFFLLAWQIMIDLRSIISPHLCTHLSIGKLENFSWKRKGGFLLNLINAQCWFTVGIEFLNKHCLKEKIEPVWWHSQ